jgi:transposase InsO family protein
LGQAKADFADRSETRSRIGRSGTLWRAIDNDGDLCYNEEEEVVLTRTCSDLEPRPEWSSRETEFWLGKASKEMGGPQSAGTCGDRISGGLPNMFCPELQVLETGRRAMEGMGARPKQYLPHDGGRARQSAGYLPTGYSEPYGGRREWSPLSMGRRLLPRVPACAQANPVPGSFPPVYVTSSWSTNQVMGPGGQPDCRPVKYNRSPGPFFEFPMEERSELPILRATVGTTSTSVVYSGNSTRTVMSSYETNDSRKNKVASSSNPVEMHLQSSSEEVNRSVNTTATSSGGEGRKPTPNSNTVIETSGVRKENNPELGSGRSFRQWIKLGTYNGRTAVEAFVKKFEVCSKHNGWTSEEKLDQLMCALVEPANQLLWEFDASTVATWEDLVRRLRSRYGGSDQTTLYQTQLSTRRQREGEELGAVVQDVRRLMTLAFPGPSTIHSETIAIRSFIDALLDKEIAMKIREHEPKSLDQAYNLAMRLEGYRKAERNVSDSNERRHGRVKLVKEETLSIEKVQKMIQEALDHSSYGHENRRTSWNYERSNPEPNNQSETREKGMWSRRPLQNRSSFRRREGNTSCYECGVQGHFAKECPNRNGRTLPSLSEGEPSHVANSNHVLGSNNAYLALRVNGKKSFALVDTGCEMSLAPVSLVRKDAIKKSQQTLRAANGTEIQVIGEAVIQCEAEHFSFSVSCLITEQISELILGLSWLERNRVQWTFGEKCLTIRGHVVPIISRPGLMNCRKVVVAHDVRVPAMSEVDVETFAVLPSLSVPMSSWATKPQLLETGLWVAGTLLKESTQHLMVRVMNPTEREVRLKKGVRCVTEDVVVSQAKDDHEPAEYCKTVKQSEVGKEQTEILEVLAPLWEGIDKDVPEEKKNELRQLLMKYQAVFSLHEWDLGHTDVIRHEIDTADEKPVKQPLRRQPMSVLPLIDDQLEQMLRLDIIEPTASPWASNVVIVKKKDGSPRFCVDYRGLNAKTRPDAYPLPLIGECLDALAGAQWFSTVDLRAGYHQVEVHPKDRHKTAFITRRGSYQFRVLPFGLQNSPASFSRMMNLVLAGLNFVMCLVYLDDVIIFAADLDTHLTRIQQVLERLMSVGLKLKPTKCHFLKRQVMFLGHLVSHEGLATDPEKVRAVEEWPKPDSLKEVRSFLGLCAYYRRFVPEFAKVARPLHGLTRKGVKFKWSEECSAAFEELKKRLTEAPILSLPNDTDTYILDTDASQFAIGAVLSQLQGGLEKVICFGSRVCTPAETNYDVTRREMLAVVFFLKTYRQYLLGRSFILRTDHAALQWLRRTPVPIGQQARWLTTLEEFDYQVQHRAGSAHGNADALSRRPGTLDACVVQEMSDPSVGDELFDWTGEAMKTDQGRDPDLGWILERLSESSDPPPYNLVESKSSELKTLISQWNLLELNNGILMRRWLDPETDQVRWLQLIPPKNRRRIIVELAHSGMTGGHLGVRKTMAQVQKRAYWPQWREFVRLVVRQCPVCARVFRGTPPRQGRMQTMTVGAPMERIGVDITGPHPVSATGYKYILTVVDHFTKWAEAYPIRNQEASTVARVLTKEFFSRFGCPRQILTDQGPNFESKLFQDLCRRLDIDKVRTSPYRPSTNGVVERFHRTLNSMLTKVVSDNHRDWDLHLPFVLTAYRASESESTGYTPNRLFLSREVVLPIDLVVGDSLVAPKLQTADDFVETQMERIQEDFSQARQLLQKKASVRAFRYDLRVKEVVFLPNDRVWYFYPRKRVGIKDKWASWYTGPFVVEKCVTPVLYKIRKTPKSQALYVHVDKLKRCEGDVPRQCRERSEDREQGSVVDVEPRRSQRTFRRPARFSC